MPKRKSRIDTLIKKLNKKTKPGVKQRTKGSYLTNKKSKTNALDKAGR